MLIIHHQEVNCINTASGIVTLCKRPSGMQVEQELIFISITNNMTNIKLLYTGV